MHSEQTSEIAKALSTAQGAIAAPKKGKTAKAGTFSYNYADLAAVIDCYREPLTKNGLAITQTTRPESGHIILVTTLLHISGQWISSEFPLSVYQKPQEQGSAITYARRYAVTALLGIAAEDDDDGATAQSAEPQKSKEERRDDTQAKLSQRQMEAQRLAMECADLTRGKDPEAEMKAASKLIKDGQEIFARKGSDLTLIKWADMTIDNLRKRASLLAGEAEPPPF